MLPLAGPEQRGLWCCRWLEFQFFSRYMMGQIQQYLSQPWQQLSLLNPDHIPEQWPVMESVRKIDSFSYLWYIMKNKTSKIKERKRVIPVAIKLIDDFLTWTSMLIIQLLNLWEFFLLSLQVWSNPSSQLTTPLGRIGCLDVQFFLSAVGKKLDFLPLPLHPICTTKLLLLQSSNSSMGRPPISWMIRCNLKLMLDGEAGQTFDAGMFGFRTISSVLMKRKSLYW